jgi:hypothetical protein
MWSGCPAPVNYKHIINLESSFFMKRITEEVATFVRSGYSARRSFSEGGLKKSECESECEHTRFFFSKLTLTLTL